MSPSQPQFTGIFSFFAVPRAPIPEVDQRPFYRQAPFDAEPGQPRRMEPRRVPQSRATPRASPTEGRGSGYRTLCVRSCDGYFWPVSWSVSRSAFARDEQMCRAACPNMEVALFTHRNPGADVAEAVALDGTRYVDLPAAFAHRREYNPSCRCRPAISTALFEDLPDQDLMADSSPEGAAPRALRGPYTPVPAVLPVVFSPPPFARNATPVLISTDRVRASDVTTGEEGLRGVHGGRVTP